mgnify:CR=1 FL=1
MGSIAGIVLREADGSIHKTSGTASDISWFVNNIRLVNKDPKHIKRFLEEYDFSHEDHQDLRPVGNGLVVVDMVQNQILRYQDVASVGYFNGINVTEAARGLIEENRGDPDLAKNIRAAYNATGDGADEYACVRFYEFLNDGRIRDASRGSDLVAISLKTAIEDIDAELRKGLVRCELDMSPFTVSTYAARTVQGARDLQSKMQELGFNTTASEQKAWENWVSVYAKK